MISITETKTSVSSVSVTGLEWPCMISITETHYFLKLLMMLSELEWPCMISITETITVRGVILPLQVGMAMYDFDHWNCSIASFIMIVLVGMAMYDFDHWNTSHIVDKISSGLEWPCMISITETVSDEASRRIDDSWNGHVWFRSLKPICITFLVVYLSWNGHVWFRSLKQHLLKLSFQTECWNGHVWFRSLKLIVLPSSAVRRDVGMAMYDFDHWNIPPVLVGGFSPVGMAMYDFDHWNIKVWFAGEVIPVGMAMYDFDHWN